MTHTPQPDNANPYPGPQVVYVQPPPKPKTGRNVALIIAGAVVFVCLGLCGVGALLFAASDDDDGPGDKVSEKELKELAGMNEPVRDGKFEFTVVKNECGQTSVGGQYFNQQAQGQFCVVEVRVKNIGNVAQTLDASNQKAYNSGGQQYLADSAASLYANENNETFLNQINPGNEVTGRFVFDIPKDQKIERVELHDSVFSGGVQVRLT